MKNYSEMSDFEINKEVATAMGLDLSGVTQESYWMYNMKDYCNSWADAGSIIAANRISLIHYFSLGDIWIAEFLGSAEYRKVESLQHSDKNPLRAAMIVFLMMKDN